SNADIRTNAATIVLDGPASKIVNQNNADALANFTTTAAAGSFTIGNGRNVAPGGAFANAGALVIGAGSTFAPGSGYTQTAGSTTLQAGVLTFVTPPVVTALAFDGANDFVSVPDSVSRGTRG